MASFYESTAVYILTGECRSEKAEPTQWQCAAENTEETLKLARDLNDEMMPVYDSKAAAEAAAPSHHLNLRRAVDRAARALRDHGPSCDLLLTWADGTRRLAEASPTDVSPDKREAAIRLLLTFSEESEVLPIGEADDASLWAEIAHYFSVAEKDYISAYVAARIALHRLDTRSAAGVAEAERRHIERYASQLQPLAEAQRHELSDERAVHKADVKP